MSFKSLRTDAKLMLGQMKDGMADGAWLVCVAVIAGALAVTFGLVVLALAVRG